MIIWLNGAFGSGKTTCAFELHRRLPNSFVYDPENVGYFIRSNVPREASKPDFQDCEQWRSFNYEMLLYIYQNYKGTMIVPMTITSKLYYEEIIERLANDGVEIKHFILYADKKTLIKRLNKRLERGDSWAKAQIDRCLHSFDHIITEEKIMTDKLAPERVVEEVAGRSGLELEPDRRSKVKKLMDRALVLIKHIR
ncbi:AAA family ATPase [Bacillus horti]|uniref:2-phosphoglycerate kinase n=1 Tax=Caldalkalibacillus horti TaxID=77523 RepID=A0ABT9VV37_9BACI|nr:AAA family ATPase [Bacillus horti]MDQ0164857.1 2-phosphoglycerate kinase [Bacillus horti]